MAGILNAVLLLGVMGFGVLAVMNRCTWFQMCGDNAAAAPAADTSAPAVDTTTTTTTSDPAPAATTSTADKKDNGKKKKCNCCNCKQINEKLIECSLPGGGKTSFTNGLSLADQCKACGDDDNICKNAKAAEKTVKRKETAKKAADTSTDIVNKLAAAHPVAPKPAPVAPKPPPPPPPAPKPAGCGPHATCKWVGTKFVSVDSHGCVRGDCATAKSARAYYTNVPARSYYGGIPSHAFVTDPYDYRVFRNRISFK